MITATVDKNSIEIDHEELITSGSVKTNFIQFVFSEDWNGLTKTAIFQTKKVSIPVIVDGEDKVAIPWEAMAFPKEEIKFGVYGVRFDDESTESVDEEIVLPTIWGSLGKVVEGVLVESPPITDPTKDAYLQLLDYIKSLQPGGGEATGGIPYVDQLVASPDTYSAHDVESLIGKSLWYLTWSGDPLKVFGELEVGKEFSAYFLYDGEQLNPTLNYYGVFVFDEYDTDLTDRIKATLKNATLIGNRTESLNSFLTFFKLDAVPELNVTTSIPFKSAVGVMPQWMNTAHRGLMTVGNELYLIDFRLELLDHDNEAFQIRFTAIYPISNSGRDGIDGVTFIPFVSSEGVISFVNDGGLPNPDPVNIKGLAGATGEDALVYSETLPFDNVTGDPTPVNVYNFRDSGTRFNRAPKLNETWTGVIVYYSGEVGENAKDVFVSTFKITSVSEEGYTSLLIDKKSVMPTITTDGSGSSEEPFITIKDKTIETPANLIAILGRNSYIGCVRAINSSIIDASFENDIVWLSFGLVLGTYYLTLITIDGYLTQAETTGESGSFDITNSTKFVREDQLDLANGTYFLGSWTEAPVVNNEYTVDISSFVGRKPVVSGQYVGTVRHDSANTLYDVSVKVKSIVDATITIKILRSTSFSSQGGGTDLTAGDGMTITDGVVSVDTPVRNILTQSEFDALPEAEQNKGMYVISDGGSNGSGGGSSESLDIYSTDERRIGTWIDGKPLYRKCYTFTTNYNDNFTDVGNVSDFFIEFASFISGTITNSINQKLQIPCLLSSGMGYFILESSMLKFYTTSTGLKGCPATCILEYTKTTDEPEVSA